MTPAEIVQQAALQAVGTPFHWQGRRAGVGLDCAGLVDHCRVALGWEPSPVPVYGSNRPPSIRMLLAGFREHLIPADKPWAAPGQVCAFWNGRPGRVRHTGIVCCRDSALWLVEAHNLRGAVTCEPLRPDRLDHLDSAWVIPPPPHGHHPNHE